MSANETAGSCDYVNQFSSQLECKAYSGSAWTATSAAASCVAGAPGALSGTWSASTQCAVDPTLGTCSVPDPLGEGMEYVLQIGGGDPLDCTTAAVNICAGLLAGTFTPSSVCAAGKCNYVNIFSGLAECKQYLGSAWDWASAESDCLAGGGSAPPEGTWSASTQCAVDPTLGTCSVPDPLGEGLEYVLQIGGGNPADCGTAAGNCAGFLAGTFTPSSICDGP